MMQETDQIRRRLEAVCTNIDNATKHAGRPVGSVELIAVSKNFPAEDVRPVLDAGQRVFGENRVQETASKWPQLRQDYPDLVLHLIGPLQSNKAADAVALFDAIHTIDREKIARALAKEIGKQDANPELFIQVNTGQEAQKAGVSPTELEQLLTLCREELGLRIAGLMCIPPADQPPSAHFALLNKLATEHGLEKLSMGMSGDYEAAIQLGATYVRVGSAIFGQRPKPNA